MIDGTHEACQKKHINVFIKKKREREGEKRPKLICRKLAFVNGLK